MSARLLGPERPLTTSARNSPFCSFEDLYSNTSYLRSAGIFFFESGEGRVLKPPAKSLISKLTEEKNRAIQQNTKLHQELELLRRQSSKSRGGVPFIYVMLIGLIGILLGYILKKT